MKTIKTTFLVLLSLISFLFVLILSVVMTIATTPNMLPFYLRQAWHDVSPYIPDAYADATNKVSVESNLKYKSIYGDNTFDIYYPKENNTSNPTIVWIHGGAFVSGSKDSLKVFATLVAAEGYTFVSMNYEVAPERNYPAPLIQVSEMVDHLKKNNDKYPSTDVNRLVIGGDSAGAHIAANFAVLQTNERLSEEMDIEPVVTKSQLKGVLLYCGPYDLSQFDHVLNEHVLRDTQNNLLNSILQLFVKQIGWSYFGESYWKNEDKINQTNIMIQVTADFPPTYITDGNSVSFMQHGINLANKLKDELGIYTQTYFPSDIYNQDFVHEYQFDFEKYHDAAMDNLNLSLDFLSQIFS